MDIKSNVQIQVLIADICSASPIPDDAPPEENSVKLSPKYQRPMLVNFPLVLMKATLCPVKAGEALLLSDPK
jgi:hypothetical protein